MVKRNEVFATFRKRSPVDPSPAAITEQERQHVSENIAAGSSVRFHVVRKLLRLSDERAVKLQRIERVVEQARERPDKYPGTYVASFISDILEGRELDG